MMNKKIIVPLMILGLGLLAGCQSDQSVNPEEIKKYAQNQERRIGMIQSLGGAFTSSQATHLLKMDDGKNLYLKSDGIDLSNSKYDDKQVEVMGEIVRTTDGNQVMTVKNIDILDTENGQQDNTPQWIDFKSDNLNLSFKYRDDYTVTESTGEVLIQKKPLVEEKKTSAFDSLKDSTGASEGSSSGNTSAVDDNMAKIMFKVISDSDEGFLSAMGISSLNSSDLLAEGYNRSKITQKAVEAYKKTQNGGGQIDYYFKAGAKGYKASFVAGSDEKTLTEDQNMFYDILSSTEFGDSQSAESGVSDSSATAADDSKPVSDEVNNPSGQAVSDTEKTSTAEDLPDDSGTITTSPDSQISGFETFSSESQKFSLQYPKSYYFGSISPASTDASKSYQFGSEPLEETPGEITLDIVKTGLPDGKTIDYDGKTMVVETSGSEVSVYVESAGKTFRLTADKTKEGLLKQMASTIQ
jgi:hypothetical protein